MSRASSRGLTALEVLIVIAILAILAVIAVPGFDDLIRNSRRAGLVNELVATLMLARSEAQKRGRPISVCGTTAGGGLTCAGGAAWEHGWLVFVDDDGDGVVAAAGDVLRRHINEMAGFTVRSSSAGGHFTMRPFNNGATPGTVTICDRRGAAQARAVVVEPSARARAAETDQNGAPLVCPAS